jgi:hypothetical protein
MEIVYLVDKFEITEQILEVLKEKDLINVVEETPEVTTNEA